MVDWFIIILVIAIIFIFFKITRLEHTRRKFIIIIIILILAFFLSTLYFVAKANEIDMTTLNGLSKGMQTYSFWLLNSFKNIKSTVGYAIKMDWNPKYNISKNSENNNDNKENEKSNEDIKIKVINDTKNAINKVKANTPKLITSYK